MTLVVALAVCVVTPAAGYLLAGAAAGPVLVPRMEDGVAGSPAVYVVASAVYPKGTAPRACVPGPCLHLLRTNDDGAHFTSLRLPRIGYSKGDDTGDLNRVVFANAKDGYVVLNTPDPSTLYVTADGAKSWHRETIVTGAWIFGLVASHDELNTVVARCTAKIGCTDFRFARSTLDAVTWSITPLRGWPKDSGAGIAAFDNDVWLSQQPPGTAVLLTSHDRGRTFSRSSVPSLGSINGCGLTAMSASALWAECPTGMQVSFFYSGDGGTSWNRTPTSQFMGTGGGAFDPVSSELAYLDYGLAPPSGAKNLYRITNSGHTMTAVGRLVCNNVDGLVFTDAGHGLAACDRSDTDATTYLLRTSDGGATWQRVNLG